MTDRHLLKSEARSLCPTCCRGIPAETYAEPGGVFMEKECPDHGRFRAMVEKDATVYRMVMNVRPVPRPPNTLVIPVTHRCNLHCTMCFLPNDGVPDPPAAAIYRLIDEFEGTIVFSGGEPTVRQDLAELISYAAKRKRSTCIATNGLAFEDRNVVASLADAGLEACLFSFNGVSDRVYEGIEGQPLLDRKLAALENVLATPILPRFSSTIVAGCNEDELADLKRFFLTKGTRALSWRVRTHAALGRHQDVPVLWMSDMLRLVCEVWGIDREQLLPELGSGIDYHGTSHAYFAVALRGDDVRRAAAAQAAVGNAGRTTDMNAEEAPLHEYCRMRIFTWPDISNVDLDEIAQTGIWHVGPGGRPMPFLEAVIRNLYAPDWDWGS